MWRHVVPGLTAVLALSGCVECDEYSYNCVWRFAPYYGYYQDCYAVRNQCWDHQHCEGGNCHGTGTACKYGSDCNSGEVCNSGHCVSKSSGGGPNGSLCPIRRASSSKGSDDEPFRSGPSGGGYPRGARGKGPSVILLSQPRSAPAMSRAGTSRQSLTLSRPATPGSPHLIGSADPEQTEPGT